MNWIQVLLLISALALVVFLLRSRRSVQARAWVKVGYLVFVLGGIYAILRPDDTTLLANLVGVRRGTDLMLYALIIAFAFTTLSTYMRFRDVELRYARLARAIALASARRPEDEETEPAAPGARDFPTAPVARNNSPAPGAPNKSPAPGAPNKSPAPGAPNKSKP